MKQLKNSLQSNATLKIVALMFGSSIWMMLNYHHTRTIELKIPVCIYDLQESKKIEAPEQITIALQGKRRDLQTLDLQSLAVHVNARKIPAGVHALIVDSATLFLPSTVKLVHYIPSNCVIKVEDTSIVVQTAANVDSSTKNYFSLIPKTEQA